MHAVMDHLAIVDVTKNKNNKERINKTELWLTCLGLWIMDYKTPAYRPILNLKVI